jgi:lipoprotein-releasing system ATP-binding protein
VLKLENVHKSFAHNGLSINVLRGIDLVVEKGESLAVTGASGAGKSTLLNIMGALEQPSEGVVRFESRNLRELGEAELCALRSRRIGFVFQFHHLLPEFNAWKMPPFLRLLLAQQERSDEERRRDSCEGGP